MNAFEKLKSHFGSVREIAIYYGLSDETVRLWGIDGLPPGRALDFENDTGGKVTIREVLEHKRQQSNQVAVRGVQK